MAALKHKFLLCFFLYYSIQLISSIEIDSKTQEKVSELVGERQNALRHYLKGVRIESRRIENDIGSVIKLADDSSKSLVDNTINEIQKITENKSKNPECIERMDHAIEDIKIISNKIPNNCSSTTKPSLLDVYSDVARYAAFQMKIGVSPKKCINSNNNAESILDCLRKTMEDVGKEMDDSERKLNDKIQQLKEQVNNFEALLVDCVQKELSHLKKEIVANFDECIEI